VRKRALWQAVAVALYAGYWCLRLVGILDISRGDAPYLSREVFYALTVGLPCFAAGVAIARWWAPAVGLIFVILVAVPERCVVSYSPPDLVVRTCSGMYADDVPLMLAVTTPCVLAGVVAIKLCAWQRLRASRRRPRVGGAVPAS
jgi:hypothetical protein